MGSHNGNRRGVLIGLAAPAAFLAFLFIVQPASADTITFIDTNNTITVSQDGSQHTVMVLDQFGDPGSCATETFQCHIFITAGINITPMTTPAMSLNISEAGIDPALAVSDYVAENPTPKSYFVLFASDRPADPSSTIGLSPIPGPSITETGDVQTAFTLTWSDGSTDTIRFQSDLDTPEPSSLLLLASGLAVLGACVGKRMLQLV